ncbi:dTDP-4-dehydrorhamnose reductase [Desulfurella sp.]|uniref:dTDP-4-dehydrorhamnose reductase n=1 Tax=Desulfurella sp. TaxID=1962857 RepID=UPI003D14B3B6
MILIFGGNGQLAKAFKFWFEKENKKFISLDRKQCDVTDYLQLKNVFETFRPRIVINASAYNLVDECEVNYFEGFKVNAFSVAHMTDLSKKFGSFFVHYSTDYVFDGSKCGLYCENDKPNPLNEYGKSKLLGEKFLLESQSECLILRTSWVYGNSKNNFISKLMGWCKNNEYLKIAYNEFSVPTSAYDIAYYSLIAINKGLSGIYHLVNSGFCSRFEWAKLTLSLLGINKFLYPVDRSIFNLKANRPFFSTMSNELFCRNLNVETRDWQNALIDFLQNYYEK